MPDALGNVPAAQGIDGKRPIRIALAGIDGGPRRAVDDHVGADPIHRLEDGVAIAHVEATVAEGGDLGTAGRRFEGGGHIQAQLAAGARQEHPHA